MKLHSSYIFLINHYKNEPHNKKEISDDKHSPILKNVLDYIKHLFPEVIKDTYHENSYKLKYLYSISEGKDVYNIDFFYFLC